MGLEFTGMNNVSVALHGARLCHNSFEKADDLGPNDRGLLWKLFELKHYSVFDQIWYEFSNMKPGMFMQWQIEDLKRQHFVYYSPISKRVLVNARTLLLAPDDDPVSRLMIDKVRPYTPVIFGDDANNRNIRSKSFEPIEELEGVRKLDEFGGMIALEIKGMSRAMLQQFIRHEQFPLVKSTRYTLKELCKSYKEHRLADLLVSVNKEVDRKNIARLKEIAQMLESGLANDKAKYMLPEAYRTHVVTVIPSWSLSNMLYQRSTNAAMWEWHKWTQRIAKACS